MPAVFRQHSQVALGVSILLGLCNQVIAADPPATLEEIREMLRQQQYIIEAQQDQIEALQQGRALSSTEPAAPTATASAAAESQGSSGQRGKLSWEGYGVVNYQHYD